MITRQNKKQQQRKQRKRWRHVDVDRLNAELGYQVNVITIRNANEQTKQTRTQTRYERLAQVD
jgi:hypothetical protein